MVAGIYLCLIIYSCEEEPDKQIRNHFVFD